MSGNSFSEKYMNINDLLSKSKDLEVYILLLEYQRNKFSSD
jgi:hypothetical protein